MGDIGERAAVHEHGVVLERLNQVGLHRILQHRDHGSGRLELGGGDGLAVAAGRGDDDVVDPALQVLDRGRQAQDGHDLGGHRDVETVFAGIAVRHAAERGDHRAKGAVVHVQAPAPGDPTGVDIELVAPVDVVVQHGGEQIVGDAYGVKVTGEVQVDFIHRDDLGVTAAGCAALDAEAGTEAGFAQTDRRPLADAIERVAEADRRGGLAFAGRGRVDGGDQDQLAVLLGGELFGDKFQADLGLVVPVGLDVRGRDVQAVGDGLDRFHRGFRGDFPVGLRLCGGVVH